MQQNIPYGQTRKMYEKRAPMTLKRNNFELIKMCASFVVIPFDIAAIVMFAKDNIKWFFILTILGVVLGFAVGAVFLLSVYLKQNAFKLSELERTEGYTQKFIDELEKYNCNSNTIASVYVYCGNPDMALSKLSDINEADFQKNPSSAHVYYSTVLMAYLLKGDMENAKAVYQRGLYFLQTYMNSPIFGDKICIALAVYEYFCTNYSVSLQLLDNALRIGVSTPAKPKQRLIDENMICIISYWRAMNFASMGNKAAAWEIINSCKNMYTTPFYKQCAEKLLCDMAENNKGDVKA